MNTSHPEDLPPPDARRYYDEFAKTGLYDYDAEAFGWPATTDALLARVLEAKPADSIKSVLDLGAGTGLTTAAIKKHVSPERAVAVDTSAKMLELLRKKYPKTEVETHTDTIQHYVAETKEQFDLITAFSVLEFLPNLPIALRDTARLLNENGVLAFTYVPQGEDDPPEKLVDSTDKMPATVFTYFWPSTEIEQVLTDSGLTVVAQADPAQLLANEEAKSLEYDFIVAQNKPSH